MSIVLLPNPPPSFMLCSFPSVRPPSLPPSLPALSTYFANSHHLFVEVLQPNLPYLHTLPILPSINVSRGSYSRNFACVDGGKDGFVRKDLSGLPGHDTWDTRKLTGCEGDRNSQTFFFGAALRASIHAKALLRLPLVLPPLSSPFPPAFPPLRRLGLTTSCV